MVKEVCSITNKEMPLDKLVAGTSITSQIVKLIKKGHPRFSTDKYISREILGLYRKNIGKV